MFMFNCFTFFILVNDDALYTMMPYDTGSRNKRV